MHGTTFPIHHLLPDEPIVFSLHALLRRLETLTDTRAARGRRYSLSFILLLVILAKLCGEDTMAGIADWAHLRREALAACFDYPSLTIPHATTISRVLDALDDWDALMQIIADVLAPPDPQVHERGTVLLVMDGKTLRGTIPSGQTQGVHLLSLYAPDQGVTLFQVAVDSKENEIVAAPRLLQYRDLTGIVITADAMQTQRALSSQIVAQGGDYLWPVKDNQPTLHADVERLFDPDLVAFAGGPAALDFQCATTVDKGHGRLEERTITVRSLLKEYSDWPYLEQVFRLDKRVTNQVTGKTTTETRYGITSQPATVAGPKKLLEQVRMAWSIENGSHYRRDVTFHEDASQIRRGKVAQVMATINTLVIGLAYRAGEPNVARVRRRWDAIVTQGLTRLLLLERTQQQSQTVVQGCLRT
jgi:predicted transposase YbfD/YdcC